MLFFKKILNLLYSLFCKIFNFYNYQKYNKIYKKNSSLNDSSFFNQVKLKKLNSKNDISDHFDNIFYESILNNPKIILELGVRRGESTYVFNEIRKTKNNIFISVDIEDCSKSLNDPNWIFIKEDSIKFLKDYNKWSKNNVGSLKPDIIFIDTSHLYKETLEEINLSSDILSANGALIFHDTNHQYINFLENNILYNKFNYNRQLGVKLALETYFNCKFNFNKPFIIIKQGWLVKHYSTSFGLTIMRKL